MPAKKTKPATIQTLNVNPNAGGARVNQERYEAVKKAILRAVPRSKQGIAFSDLPKAVARNLPGGKIPGGGSISWYVTTIKLDLEARGLIHRIPGTRPQRLTRQSI